jgi:type IV pilus assembly protein PilQ
MKRLIRIASLVSVLVSMSALFGQESTSYRVPERRISLNVEQADIRTVLRSISEFSGMNIVAGSKVEGPVTVLLHDVSWREALDNILKMNDFVAVEDKGIIRVTTHEDIQNAVKNEKLETGIFQIKYARAEQLRDVVGKLLSERGRAQADVRSNTLLITDIPANIEAVREIVAELDKETNQVLVEAKIVEVDTRGQLELGIDWSFGNLDNPGQPTKAGAEITLGPSSPTGSFTVGRLQKGVALEAILKTLEEDGHAEILSEPSVLISDNETAVILSGKKIPINTVDQAGNIITEFYDVAVKLQVMPHINPNNQVLMDLHPEVSDLSGEATVSGGIIILTSEISTKLLVDDGQTVVIGGVMRSKKDNLERRVPLLHAIPLIGRLFTYTSNTLDKTEIMIFVTPRVVPAKMTEK